jgi:hypothetical protein
MIMRGVRIRTVCFEGRGVGGELGMLMFSN